MSVLDKASTPAQVKALAESELGALASDVRSEIIEAISKTGGHLASSLGAVELSIALLRVFDPPRDKVVWDVGHQSYAWKMLTGRRDRFGTIRTKGGLSGFPNPVESSYDAFVAGHAGVALAAAEGMCAARELGAEDIGDVVAVVGDASMTNGETLEALNNVSQLKGRVILVLNDNEMSISRNVGGFARFLGRLLTGLRYNRVKKAAEDAGHKLKLSFLRGPYHRLEQMIKSIWLGNSFFENFGLRYIGPVDGHDIKAVENALRVAREDKRSVVVHVCTVKGKGYQPAERHPTEWHGVGKFEVDGEAGGRSRPAKRDWSAVFGETVEALAARDARVCALTAAMRSGTGLDGFAKRFPSRFFDSGICESHLVTFAAGLAKSGMRPVVAIYSTFLQRAVDQVIHDVCLMGLPVIFAIDRAGAVGADGRTHQGVFDIPLLRCIPGISIMQPCDESEMKAMFDAALERGGPVAIRYPRGLPPAPVEAPAEPIVWGKARQISGADAKIQIWALGEMVGAAVEAARILSSEGIEAGVVDARFAKPVDEELLRRQTAAGMRIASIENGSLAGGFGEALMAASGGHVMRFGWPDVFLEHSTQAELMEKFALDAASVARAITEEFA